MCSTSTTICKSTLTRCKTTARAAARDLREPIGNSHRWGIAPTDSLFGFFSRRAFTLQGLPRRIVITKTKPHGFLAAFKQSAGRRSTLNSTERKFLRPWQAFVIVFAHWLALLEGTTP